ncbi:MAG: Na+/H+ antiporter subunit D [Chloroflexaceae bacterium]|nr:Na+/H+ antiporter subunit D [Chloroflexaceae bacterium]
MNVVVILPLLVPFLTAIFGFLAWGNRQAQRLISVVGSTVLLIASLILLWVVSQQGIQATQAGDWPAPFGITFVADTFSAIMVVMVGVMGLSTVIYSLVTIDVEREAQGFHPLIHMLFVGVCGAFLTGDIFNLYVWYEVMLIASFVLLVMGGERSQLEGGIKYVTLNLLASALFLAAVGLLYGLTGTLNMAHLSEVVPTLVEQQGMVTVVAMLFLFAFGIKGALFPLFFWLPASYHTPPIAVTVIFSALLTKVGVYSLIRVFTLIFTGDAVFVQVVLLVIAGFTMVTGVLGAVAQYEMRRLLSFHIISQIGYLLMGLALFTPLSLAASVFFMAHVILAKSALFLVGGVLNRLAGTYDLKKLGGFYRVSPVLAVLFFIPAMSLAGIPPLSGFWAKFALIRAGLETQQYAIVAASLVVSVLTLFSMTKIWAEAFLKEKEQEDGKLKEGVEPVATLPISERLPLLAPIAVIAMLMIVMGVGAEPFFNLALQASEEMLTRTEYVQAVLGGQV